jgi:membrane protein required for colicin V production
MGIFDWLLLLFLVFVIWRGWRKGFIGMLLHLAGVILVFFLVAHYFPMVKQGLMLKLHLGNVLSTILAVILIVAMIALIVQIIRMLLEKAVKLMHISFLNSSMGALLGFLTGLLFIVVLSLLIELVPSFNRALANTERHRVYAAVRVVRSELFTAFKISYKAPDIPSSFKVIDVKNLK